VPNVNDKTASLFISCVPGTKHGEADDSRVAWEADDSRLAWFNGYWVCDSGLEEVLAGNLSGGVGYQPDISSVRPDMAEPAPPGGTADSDPSTKNMPYRRLLWWKLNFVTEMLKYLG
jgi:hypothetical protein